MPITVLANCTLNHKPSPPKNNGITTNHSCNKLWSGKLGSSFTIHKPPYEYEEPFDIPDSWETASMSDLFLLNPKSEVSDDMDAGFIPMALVEDGFSGKHSFEIREWGDIKKGYCHFQTGDIGVAKISPCFENLKSCIFECLPNNIGAGTTELVILRSLGVYAPFYLYLLKSQWYISQGTKYFKGVVGQQRVNKEIFTDLMVPLPPIEEQKRIVEEVNRLFGIIDAMERGKSDLQTCIKQAKSKILDLAIHGKLVPQDPNDEPVLELLKRINPKTEITCDTPRYGKLPSGWRFVSVGSYVNLVTDFVASGSFASLRENVKYYNSPEYAILVRTKDFQNNFQKELVYTDKHGYEFLEKSNLHGGELVFSNVGSIGKVFIVPHLKQKMTLAPNAIMVRFHHDEHQKWFYYLFQSSIGLDLLHSITSATAIGKFNKTDFKKLVIPIPPLSEQHRIVAKIEELFAQLDKIEASL